jgi:ABC-2 type transport system permease protein
MRKYLEIALINFKAQFAWRADAGFAALVVACRVVFAYLLWGILFRGKAEIGGLGFGAMLSYYVVSSFLTQVDMSDRVAWELNSRVRDGSFSKYLVIPASPQAYFVAQVAGVEFFYVLIDFAAALACAFVFRFGFSLQADVGIALAATGMILLGLLFMVLFNYSLGLLTFRFQDIWPFYMIKNNLVLFASGAIVPLSLLPETVQGFMRYLPFYYVGYLPSMLLVGRKADEAAPGLLVLGLWCLGLVVVNKLMYEGFRRRYEGVGI